MNTYKVGDKVLYDGEVHTVIQIPIDKDYVVLDLHYKNAVHHTEIEPYFSPHERLLKLGWEMVDTDGTSKTYYKFDDKYSRRTMSIKINKDKDGWYFTTSYSTYIDKELTTILLEYLEELERYKMSKSIYEEALDNTQILLALVDVKQLNAKKKINMLYQIEHALEQAQKQEKLLDLYRQLSQDLGLVIEHDTTDDWTGPIDYEYLEINEDSPKALNTYKQIKELEK